VYYALIVLAEPPADVLGQSDIEAVRLWDSDNDVDEMHDGFAGCFLRCIIYLCCDTLWPQNRQINAFLGATKGILHLVLSVTKSMTSAK
jgi:hypothetical protein